MAYNTTNANAELLKVFSGEVLKAFDQKNIGLKNVKTRTITNGRSAQFPVIGKANDTDVLAHTPGDDVTPNVIDFAEKVITIDQRYYYSLFLDDFETKMIHFEYRGELAKQMAEALSTKIDKAIFNGILKAVDTTPVAGQESGTVILNTDTANSDAEVAGDAIVESIFEASAAFNAKDVPEMGRVFITTPQNYYKLVQSGKAVNRDFTGGNGGIDTGKVFTIAGVPIYWSNHIPTTYTADLDGDGTAEDHTVQGLFFTPDAYGVVKLMDITSESNYIPEKLGYLLTSYYALGMDVLNPGAAGVIVS